MHIFRNTQWVVTDEGVEAPAEGGYWIDIDRMSQETQRQGITYYDWPIHLAEKEWVAIPLFLEAFVRAIRFCAKVTGEPVDEAMLARTIQQAAAVALLTQQCEADSLLALTGGKRFKAMLLHDYVNLSAIIRYGECSQAVKKPRFDN